MKGTNSKNISFKKSETYYDKLKTKSSYPFCLLFCQNAQKSMRFPVFTFQLVSSFVFVNNIESETNWEKKIFV